MSDDIQGWMGIDVIDENCIRLSHDLGWCHMTPDEVIVLTARLAEAVVTAMKIDGAKLNAEMAGSSLRDSADGFVEIEGVK